MRHLNLILLLTFCFTTTSLFAQEQDFLKLKRSSQVIRSGVSPRSNFNPIRILRTGPLKGRNHIYQIYEESSGEFVLTRFDQDLNEMKKVPLDFTGETRKADMNFRAVIFREGKFHIFYEYRIGRKFFITCLRVFDEEGNPVGSRVELGRIEYEKVRISFRASILPTFDYVVSTDSSKVCISTWALPENKDKDFVGTSYIIYDINSGTSESFTDIYNGQEEERSEFSLLLNNNSLYSFYAKWKPKEKKSTLKYFIKEIRSDGKGIIGELPIDDIWIKDLSFRLSGDTLTILSTFCGRDAKYIPEAKLRSIHGVAADRLLLSTMHHIGKNRIRFQNDIPDKNTFLYNEDGTVLNFQYSIHSVLFNTDGSIDAALSALTEHTEYSSNMHMGNWTRTIYGYLPAFFRLDKNFNLINSKVMNASYCDDYYLNAFADFHIYSEKNKLCVLMLDKKDPYMKDDKACLGKENDVWLCTYEFDKFGGLTKNLLVPFKLSNKVYLDLKNHFFIDASRKRMYLYVKKYRNGADYAQNFNFSYLDLP
jgi:hypothetical protein